MALSLVWASHGVWNGDNGSALSAGMLYLCMLFVIEMGINMWLYMPHTLDVRGEQKGSLVTSRRLTEQVWSTLF